MWSVSEAQNEEIAMSATIRWHRTYFSALVALIFIAGPGIPEAKAGVYGDLGGAWWAWAFDTGFAQFGAGTVDCSVGQSGDTWFLAGTFGGPAERSCTIPSDKKLFFPLVNQAIFYEVNVDPDVFDLTVQEKRIFLDSRVGGGSDSDDPAVAALYDFIGAGFRSGQACDLRATLDGEPVIFTTPIVREQSSPFTLSTEGVGGDPANADPEALADGFYVLLEPLASGEHVLQFSGATCDVLGLGHRFFRTSATYTLTVN
jgi:hypothetical protein